MPTEQEWQEQVRKLQVELEQLRKRLRENETLMHRATRKASDMMLLQEKYQALQKEVRQLKRNNTSKSGLAEK